MKKIEILAIILGVLGIAILIVNLNFWIAIGIYLVLSSISVFLYGQLCKYIDSAVFVKLNIDRQREEAKEVMRNRYPEEKI